MNDKATEGNYLWLNGRRELLTSDLWHTGEPNDYGGSEKCVAIHNGHRAFDHSCNENLEAVCEKRFIL